MVHIGIIQPMLLVVKVGFATTAAVNQYYADVADLSNNQRVSWHTGNIGRCRLGSLIDLFYNRYYKIILKRDH